MTETIKEEHKPNSKQQECIDNIDGQYLVLAGPGTGKTFTVVKRIKHIIESGTAPEKVLCLTFTEAAANEMKKRIDKELKLIDSDINVYTYHSFCNEIIKENSQEFELPDNYRLISDAVSRMFVKECINELGSKIQAYRTEKNDPYYYIKDIINGINDIKQNRLDEKQYFENLKESSEWEGQLSALKSKRQRDYIDKGKNPSKEIEGLIEKQEKRIAKAKELWVLYELYSKKMEKYHYIDFNDMISMVLNKFEKDAGLLAQVANKYEYILVDEYQDTNKSQNDIVFNLVKGLEKKNIFVVGDDDQIIYSFQGARLDTIERFLTEFPDTKVICLKENMRSTQTILDVAREVAKQDSNRLEAKSEFAKYNISKDLIAKNEKITAKNRKVRFYKYADETQERNEIVREIEEIINGDDCPRNKNGEKDLSEIAILTKNNDELEEFAQLLKERNILYELKDGKNIFSIKSVIIMLYYMELLVNAELHSDKIFRILQNPPFNMGMKDYVKLYTIKSKKKSIIDSMRELKPEECEQYEIIDNFIKTYDELRKYISTENIKNILLEIGSKTGIFEYYLNAEKNKCENIAGLKKLLDEAKSVSEVSKTKCFEEFVEDLNTYMIEDVDIKTDKAPVKMNAVQLSTYHSAKGKEYEYVYMPTLFRSKWESSPKSNKAVVPLDKSEAKTDDDYKALKRADSIRVMFVGMTRAKHTLRLSYYTPTSRNMKLTELISSIQDMFEREPEPFEYDEPKYWSEMAKTLRKEDCDYDKEFRYLVDSYLESKKFSASTINTYLKCPQQYLYKYIYKWESKANIADAANYGSAIHKACQDAVDAAIKTGEYLSKEEFINAFKKEMENQAFSTYEKRQIFLERGEKELSNFYHHLKDNKRDDLYKTEAEITFNLEGNEFVGYIDRLDKHKDGSFSIYDYKTGDAKNGSQIGIGKDHEDYYNQIGLYKYFIEQSENCTVRETVFVFPQEPEKNFSLALSDKDCIDIKNKFLQAIADIKSYKFEPRENKDMSKAPCKYCSFKELCISNK